MASASQKIRTHRITVIGNGATVIGYSNTAGTFCATVGTFGGIVMGNSVTVGTFCGAVGTFCVTVRAHRDTVGAYFLTCRRPYSPMHLPPCGRQSGSFLIIALKLTLI